MDALPRYNSLSYSSSVGRRIHLKVGRRVHLEVGRRIHLEVA